MMIPSRTMQLENHCRTSKTGAVISERTVGTHMRQMGIRAQWSKPWTMPIKDSDFSTELQNILNEQFNP